MQYPLQGLKIAYKPQHIYSKYQGTTKELLNQVKVAPDLQDVVKERIFRPLDLMYLLDKNVEFDRVVYNSY